MILRRNICFFLNWKTHWSSIKIWRWFYAITFNAWFYIIIYMINHIIHFFIHINWTLRYFGGTTLVTLDNKSIPTSVFKTTVFNRISGGYTISKFPIFFLFLIFVVIHEQIDFILLLLLCSKCSHQSGYFSLSSNISNFMKVKRSSCIVKVKFLRHSININ